MKSREVVRADGLGVMIASESLPAWERVPDPSAPAPGLERYERGRSWSVSTGMYSTHGPTSERYCLAMARAT